MANRTISVQIVGDSRSLERAFSRAGKAGGTFGKTMRGLGKVAAVGMGGGFLAAGLAMRRGFAELVEGQKVTAQTRAVLKSTGGAANVTAKQVDKLSTSIAGMSGLDDEAIAGAQNLLLTFTKIRNQAGKGNKIFDKATMAVTDMSVALGMDLNSAAMMVGKALNQMDVTAQGNVRGFMALRRVGVQITPAMMAQAKAFIAANKPMEAQKLLLRELSTEFGGSAKAYGSTIQGTLGRLNNAFDEITASFASGFLPMLQKVAKALTGKLADPAFVARVRELGNLIGTKLYNAFAAISGWFEAHWPQIKSAFRTGGELALKLAAAARGIANAFRGMASVIPGGEGTLMGAILGGVMVAKLAGVLKSVQLLRTRLLLLGAAPWIIPISLILLNKDAIDDWVQKKVGRFYGGGTFSGTQEGFEKLPKEIQQRFRDKGYKPPRARGAAGHPGKAMGGSVMAGMTYRVGERGPEMLTMGRSGGFVTPNGGGAGVLVTGDITLQLDKSTVARITLKELQRMAGSNAAARRGRYGGANLALG